MRLGVLFAGEGVGALGAIGLLRALERRGMDVHAVCGMGAGAYPAALWACGMTVSEMARAADAIAMEGGHLLDYARAKILAGNGDALIQGRRVSRLLLAHTRGLAIRACLRPAAFVCMAIPSRRTVVFSTHEEQNASAVWTDHAPVWFAARTALGAPPLLRPTSFIGIPLCAHPDAREGMRALYQLGATHVAAVYPVYVRGVPKTLVDLFAWESGVTLDRTLAHTQQIRVTLPDFVAPLGFDAIPACIRAGEQAGMGVEREAFASSAGKILVLRR